MQVFMSSLPPAQTRRLPPLGAPKPLGARKIVPTGEPRRPAVPLAARRTAGRLLGLLWGLAGILTGCASSFHWMKEGFTAQHAEAKLAACQLEAERLRYFSSEPEEERAARTRHEAGLCMKADGWRWVESDGEVASEAPDAAAEKSGGWYASRRPRPDSERSTGAEGEPKPADPASKSTGPSSAAAAEPTGEKATGAADAKSGEDDEDDDEDDEE